MIFHVEPNFYSDDVPIISDIVLVSGEDREGDFKDDHLVQRACLVSTVQ